VGWRSAVRWNAEQQLTTIYSGCRCNPPLICRVASNALQSPACHDVWFSVQVMRQMWSHVWWYVHDVPGVGRLVPHMLLLLCFCCCCCFRPWVSLVFLSAFVRHIVVSRNNHLQLFQRCVCLQAQTRSRFYVGHNAC
jgi:hypothetical protein